MSPSAAPAANASTGPKPGKVAFKASFKKKGKK